MPRWPCGCRGYTAAEDRCFPRHSECGTGLERRWPARVVVPPLMSTPIPVISACHRAANSSLSTPPHCLGCPSTTTTSQHSHTNADITLTHDTLPLTTALVSAKNEIKTQRGSPPKILGFTLHQTTYKNPYYSV